MSWDSSQCISRNTIHHVYAFCHMPAKEWLKWCNCRAMSSICTCMINRHIEAEIKWGSFCGRHFQTHFLLWNTGHYLRWWWLSLLTYICVTLSRCIIYSTIIKKRAWTWCQFCGHCFRQLSSRQPQVSPMTVDIMTILGFHLRVKDTVSGLSHFVADWFKFV